MNKANPETEKVDPDLLSGRRFVLLQGPSSRYFSHLGRALAARGGTVTRVGFCPGDRLYWSASAGEYRPYRGRADGFSDWLRDLLAECGTTDVIMLGDGRAPHVAAARLIRDMGSPVRLWIVEHGYLRPDLILIEPDAMGGASTIPDRFADAVPMPSEEAVTLWRGSFVRYASMDVAYHLSNVLFSWFSYPHSRAHSGIHPLSEYGGWIGKALAMPRRRRQRRLTLKAISEYPGPWFLFPLQLSQDMQLVRYGTGEAQAETLRRVARSFLAHAEPAARLVVKTHPLDNGLENWRSMLAEFGPRVLYLDGGDLDRLLSRMAGVVTVNSTVGLTSLQAGVPTLALGQAVYKSAGLTDTQPLDRFWSAPSPPDRARVEGFCAFIRSGFHVPGSFDGPGAVVGANGVADWLGAPPDCLRAGAT